MSYSQIESLKNWLLENPNRARKGSGYLSRAKKVPIHVVREAKKQARETLIRTHGGVMAAILESKEKLQHRLNQQEAALGVAYSELEAQVVKFTEDVDSGTAEMTGLVGSPIKDLDDLVKKCKIDLDKWEIVKYTQNYWGNEKYPCWQVKAELRPKRAKESEIIEKLLENYKASYKPLSKRDILLNDNFGRPCAAFIDLTDFHLDRLTLDKDTLAKRTGEYYKVVDTLLYRAYRFAYLQEIAYVIGSDFFNADNYFGSTTKGTPQDVNSTWYESYEAGFDLQVRTINKLKQFCDRLHVILIMGNHDRTKSFYMAHALEKYFSSDPNIVFDRAPKNRKVYVFGNTFQGLHHGDCRIKELPLIFAKEYRELWGKCAFHEIKVGDKHFYYEQEISGVRIKQLPSLAGPDRWSDNNNYVNNTRAGICNIYDFEKGRIAEFEERI
jgi:hypothetical protein